MEFCQKVKIKGVQMTAFYGLTPLTGPFRAPTAFSHPDLRPINTVAPAA